MTVTFLSVISACVTMIPLHPTSKLPVPCTVTAYQNNLHEPPRSSHLLACFPESFKYRCKIAEISPSRYSYSARWRPRSPSKDPVIKPELVEKLVCWTLLFVSKIGRCEALKNGLPWESEKKIKIFLRMLVFYGVLVFIKSMRCGVKKNFLKISL